MITELDREMKALEIFGEVAIPREMPFALRLDGRSFSKLTERNFRKPFDPLFFQMMDATCLAVLEEFGGLYAFTQSDEMSILFSSSFSTFDRRVEKLVSCAASYASAVFSREFIEPAVFDARVVGFSNRDDIKRYFAWRAQDGYRNAVNTACYWKSRNEGSSPGQATKLLHDFAGHREKQDFLGPAWDQESNRSKHGRAFVWERYEKEGFNPLTGEACTVSRRRIVPIEGGILSKHNLTLERVIEEDRT